ncbi:aspartate/glutamate racemase family protein [Mesobacterium sp. TK19101]|uniref:Aspartate/glutamate racemase family protein n=1 Tax=Mesobacterium hydrothermale TaxID=3111907 RepID=A0ABU6HJW3_9RHOB|nr:aspartate/glutamate racemase family protein [Mesobacterium sp. TK19101]MEC3862606.1 aspartate/glutamate racemase family protein [Mesobacterium sp. TK19101]
MRFAFSLAKADLPRLGLIVLQADETIEGDFRRMIPATTEWLVTRVPSGEELTADSIRAMEAHLGAAAGRLPRGGAFDAVAYACTSGAAGIGTARVASMVRDGVNARAVSDPVTALLAACGALGITRLGLLSPYVAEVSDRLRQVLAEAGVETPVFGSFEEEIEARVVRIDAPSICNAAETLAARGGIDALFLSCTNLRTLEVIAPLEARLGLPVLSSNQVLAWHMLRLAGVADAPGIPGRLARVAG